MVIDHTYEGRVRRAAVDAAIARLRAAVHFRLMARARRHAKSPAALTAFIREHLQAPDETALRALEPELQVYLVALRSLSPPRVLATHLVGLYLEAARAALAEVAETPTRPWELPAAFERAVGRLETDIVAALMRAMDEERDVD